MYKNFFGFKERPFQLVPNPAYLFLSRSHEDALAHLTYAVSQGDGFVEITGEVGTGKTTLCRVFLENLDASVEAAYIFNPMLNSIQLLKAINDEFGIGSESDNTKELIDRLNVFLMEKKAQGKKPILLIDEAQNLNSEVLEQLRLLSNLETNTHKLLQIILVGQPELREMLDSRELRQLGQRITLSCHLNPLNLKETREYIRHRLRIASQKENNLFNRSAVKAIHNYSGGIPRLINIACDRSLLTAYGLNRHKISGNIARSTIRELAGRSDNRRYIKTGSKAVLAGFSLCAAMVLIVLFTPRDFNFKNILKPTEAKVEAVVSKKIIEPPEISSPPLSSEMEIQIPEPPIEKTEPIAVSESVAWVETADPVVETAQDSPSISISSFKDYFDGADKSQSGFIAIQSALKLWKPDAVIHQNLNTITDQEQFFRIAAGHNGLSLLLIDGTLDLLKKLNLPAILELRYDQEASPAYLTLIQLEENLLRFQGKTENEVIQIASNELDKFWKGKAFIVWNNFYHYIGIIPRSAPEESVMTLKMLLKDIGFNDIRLNTTYDEQAKNAVETIQSKNGILVDGTVGPLTKIVLYNELKSLKIPHIRTFYRFSDNN